MRLDLVLPDLGKGITLAEVSHWHKEKGSTIAFGDVLCDVEAREAKAVDRTKDASKLTRRRKGRGAAEDTRTIKMRLRFRIIAAEGGTLEEIIAPPGRMLKLGEVMAVVQAGSEPGDAAPGARPQMRVVADVIDRTSEVL